MNSAQQKTKLNFSEQLHASRSAKKLIGKQERLSLGSAMRLSQFLINFNTTDFSVDRMVCELPSRHENLSSLQ